MVLVPAGAVSFVGSLMLLVLGRLELTEAFALPLTLPASVLVPYWVVMGCWRRTFWGQPDDAALAEAAQPLTARQDRLLGQLFPLGALACVLALAVALALQLLWVD